MGVGGSGSGGADNDDDPIYANVPEVSGVANVSHPFSSHRGCTKTVDSVQAAYGMAGEPL